MNFSMNRRAAFLESAQAEMIETIGTPPVVEAIGEQTVQRLVKLNDQLFIPNIRQDRVVIPEAYMDTEAVPYLAMKPGEIYVMDQSMQGPTPLQGQGLGAVVAEIWGPSYNAEAMARTLIELPVNDSASREPAKVAIKDNRGMVIANIKRVEIPPSNHGSQPTNIGIRGRPLLSLAYTSGYASNVTLAHELIHVDQYLGLPIVATELQAAREETRRMELEAYHYSVRYGWALYSAEQPPQPRVRNELADLYMNAVPLYQLHPLLENYNVESARQRHADPDRPFEPTEAVMKAMKATGHKWAADDFLPHSDVSS